MDIYRGEIIEAQKIRADFMKWKLILVGAIGGTGLASLKGDNAIDTLIFAVIPFVRVCGRIVLSPKSKNTSHS